MALKEFKGRMLPSAPSSTLTVTSSMLLWCGSFICRTVRILVLPSGSISLLMVATDFDLEMVENDFLIKSVLSWWYWKELASWRFSCWSPWGSALSPWRSVLSPWRSSEWSWKEADSMLWALLVTNLLLDLEQCGLPLPLHPLDVLRDSLFPSSWLLRPTICTEVIFIATLVTFLAPHWAFSRWVRRSTFAACLTLATLGPLA